MSEVIVFTSGKGGVGKSNLCLNTALQLTAEQYRTCLFDGDLGLANVNILLGIDQEYTLDDVVFRDKSIDDILVQTGYGFDIIPGSSGVEQVANLTDKQLDALIGALTAVADYDYFLIDTASGISKSVISFCMAAHQTIIVITHEATSLTDAYALLKILSVNNYQGSVRVLVNDCDSIPQAKSTYLRYKKVVDKHLDISIAPAGIILHDAHFERAVVQQKPLLELYPESIAAQCIRAFVANLVSDQGGHQGTGPLSDFWQRYLELIREDEAAGGRGGRGQDSAGPEFTRSGLAQAGIPYQAAMAITSEAGESLFRSASLAGGYRSSQAFLAAIFKRLNQGDISAEELKQAITVDPALMIQALTMSPLEDSVPQRHIHSLEQVTSSLNDEDLYPLLLQAAFRSAGKGGDDNGEDRKRWLRGYRCAVLAKEIGQAVSFAFPDEAYLCGLLLDIARPWQDGGEDQPAAVDHAAAGADLLQSLGLNSMMCDALRFHRHPAAQVGTAFTLVRVVYGANALVDSGDSADNFETVGEMLDLDREQLKELLDGSGEVARRTAAWLGLDISESPENAKAISGKSNLSTYLLENLLTNTVMPPLTRSASIEDWARRFHRSCSLLLGLRRIICFVADDDRQKLTAVGFDDCFCGDNLDNLVIPADNTTSLLSKSFTTGSPAVQNLADESAVVNLGDRQLGRLLGGTTMICVPLKANGTTHGLLVCSGDDTSADQIGKRVDQLLGLGARAARDLQAISLNRHSPSQAD